MKETEAIDQLKRIFVPFPSIKDYLRTTDSADATLTAWASMLTHSDAADVKDVVDEILRGQRAAVGQYQKPDMVARNIRDEANDRRSKRNAKRKQEMNYHQDLSHLRGTDPKLGVYWREALRLGGAVKAKEITKDENADRMAILSDWYGGRGPSPDWLQLPASIS